MRPPFDGHGFGEPLDGMFGGGIDRAVNAADMRHLAGNVDQRSRPSGRHQPLGHGAGQEIGPLDIEIGHRVEIGLGGLQRRGVAGKPRRIDQHVEGAVFGNGGPGRGNVRHIERQGFGAETGGLHFTDQRRQLARRARRNHDMRARLGQCGGRGQADPG